MWESQTTESALGWHTRYILPRHTLELTLEVILELTLEVILEHVLGIKTMISLTLDHIATAYLYLGINTGEKDMIIFLVIVLDLSQDWSWSTEHALRSFFCRSFLSLIISIWYHNHYSLTTVVILVALTWHAPLTLCVYLRLAKRPNAQQFANSNYKNNPQVSETTTALLQAKEGYQPNEPPLCHK